MSKILLDTNLLIYAIDEESKYFNSTQELLNNNSLEIFTSSKNISEFLSVVTRIPNSGLTIDEALLVVREFQKTFTILYPSENSLNIFFELLKKYSPHGLNIHDFEIASIALSNEINNIATFNKKDFVGISEVHLVELE